MAIRFGVSSTVKNRLPRYSNFWDGTAVYSPFSPTGSYDALATYTVPSGGVSEVTFSGIPTGGQYSHLQVRYISRGTASGNSGNGILRFNSDTGSNYSCHLLWGDGSSAFGAAYTSQTFIYTDAIAFSSTASGIFTAGVVDILDYASTSKYKTVRILSGNEVNSAYTNYMGLTSGLWMNTSAVNSVTLLPSSGNFAQYTQISLYGIRG